MNEQIRKLWTRLNNVVTRAVVDRADSTGRYLQLLWCGDRVSGDVEHLEPQGVHFAPAADSSAVMLSPGGSRAGVVALGAGSNPPADALEGGEGGLHYLGAWRVFLAKDGTLALGDKVPDNWVAVAEYVDARLSAIQQAFDAHTHTVATTGSSTAQTGTAAAPSSPIGSLESVASTTVRVTP